MGKNFMFTYTPHYKPNQLLCGHGQTALITGWTVRQSLAKKLSTDDYAVIGNLYSATRGISPLIRNLLANPPGSLFSNFKRHQGR